MKRRLVLLSALLLLAACASAPGTLELEQEEQLPAGPVLSTAPLAALPACPEASAEYVTTIEVLQTPDLPEPPPRVPFLDPVFGTCVVRVTDRSADLARDDPSAGLKNEYSRVQSFNADGSYILVRSIDAYWYLYDAHTLQPLAQLPLRDEPRWDAADPNLIYHSEGTRLLAHDVSTGAGRVVHDFAEDFGQELAAVWTRYEGSPSADSRYWGLMAEDENWLAVALLVYDRTEDRVVATRDLSAMSDQEREIDSVTVSPMANYFLAYHDLACEPGQLGTKESPCGLMVYDRDLADGRSLLRTVGHSDVALDPQGHEVLVYQDIDTDHIAMLDLQSGVVTDLFPIDFSHTGIGLHFSGRALDRPGWALVSTHSGGHPTDYTWMDDQIFAIELAPGGRVVRLAHTHSLVDEEQEHDYWAEPHASVNRDFTRVLFTSNWGRSGTEQVDMYLVEVRPF